VNVLLDTHAFVWWDVNPGQLSATALTAIRDPANKILLSVVSVWEILIKSQTRKMALRAPLTQIVAHQQANGFQILQVTLDHVYEIGALPPVHKDPFDRLLIAQANVENAVLLTVDRVFAQYPVQVLW
jgi:PIN domain nuclease of toxin-antitoxin system